MKRLLSILILTLACIVGGHAQELSVQSFMLAETDLTANTPGTMVHDQNGNVCALIKVETTQKGFTFDVGVLGVMSVVEKPAEIWVYVPYGVRKITIQHPQLGMLRDYQIPCAIEKGRTYIMKLVTGSVRTVVEYAQTKQFLHVELNPADAILEINGKVKPVENGVYEELLPFGKYQYKAYRPDYHELAGIVEVSDPENTHNLSLELKAAFGYLSVLSTAHPEIEGATVYVDDRYLGKIPLTKVQLTSGSHRLRIIKEMYEPYNETFTISDEETQLLTPRLAADFAEVTLVTGDEAEIYVNGDFKAKHSWTGRLASGSYIFESRQQGHVPYKMSYDISNKDQSKTIQIQSPTPIYGSLAISSTPSKAKITLDGKSVGETPKYIARQVIGKYTVNAEMEGYEKQTKTVEVVEGTEASLAFVLEKEVVKVEEPQVASSDAYIDKVIMTFLNEKGGSYTFSKKGTAFGSDGKTYFKVSAVNDNQIAVSVYGQTNASSFSNNSLTMTLENGRATASNDALRLCRYNRFNVEFTLEGSELTISASYTTSSYASFSIEHTVLLDFLSMAQANITSETISGDFVLKVKGVEYPMVFVEGGTFRMGSNDKEASSEAKPVHNVTLSNYHIGKYEVTQELWEAVMGSNPSSFKGARRPVETVSWRECQEFIRKLNNLTGKNFKLPTEAQWEYAARGGKKSRGYKYSGSNNIDDVAWYSQNSRKKTHVVGAKNPNELGIHDMNGNVAEWCNDWYASYDYFSQTNPSGPSSGTFRVNRGCGFKDGGIYHHVSKRYCTDGGNHFNSFGFRLCL